MERDLTRGSIRKGLILFSLPLIAGNLLQQCYNIVDTWVVGRYLGSVALAAVGSAFSLMTLLTSLLLGLCMGSGVVMSQLYGQGDREGLRRAMGNAFVGIALAALALELAAFALLDSLLVWMRVPAEAAADLRGYLAVVFWGIGFTFLYNFFATALRSVGNSAAALWFLLCATIINIVLDLWFVTGLGWGVEGAALATVIAQAASAGGIALYFFLKMGDLRPGLRHLRPDGRLLKRIRAGLCQRVCHLCRAERRRGPRGPGEAGASGSGHDVVGFLRAGVGGGGNLCRAAAEHFHRPGAA